MRCWWPRWRQTVMSFSCCKAVLEKFTKTSFLCFWRVKGKLLGQHVRKANCCRIFLSLGHKKQELLRLELPSARQGSPAPPRWYWQAVRPARNHRSWRCNSVILQKKTWQILRFKNDLQPSGLNFSQTVLRRIFSESQNKGQDLALQRFHQFICHSRSPTLEMTLLLFIWTRKGWGLGLICLALTYRLCCAMCMGLRMLQLDFASPWGNPSQECNQTFTWSREDMKFKVRRKSLRQIYKRSLTIALPLSDCGVRSLVDSCGNGLLTGRLRNSCFFPTNSWNPIRTLCVSL